MKPDFTTPRYYATHAMEDLSRFRDHVKKSPFFLRAEVEYFDAILTILKESVKFILPAEGHLVEFGTEMQQSQLDMVKLPFPTICLEFPCKPSIIDPERCATTSPTSKRCVVAQETNLDGKDGILMIPVFYADTESQWTIYGVHFFFPYQQQIMKIPMADLPVDWRQRLVEEQPRVAKLSLIGAVEARAVVGFPTYLKRMAKKVGKEVNHIVNTMMYEAQSDFRVLAEFCNVVNCSNVELETVPAPAKLNRKRAEAKKLPLFEYKVLTIAPGKMHTRSVAGVITDHRESPRQHLRRGHIRRYQSGITIWITSQLIGDPNKGRVEKDYKVKPSMEAAVS